MQIRWYQQSSHGTKCAISEKNRLPPVAIAATTKASQSSYPSMPRRSARNGPRTPTSASAPTRRSPAPRTWPTTPSTARATITSWVTPRLHPGKERRHALGRAAAHVFFLATFAVAPAATAAAVTAAARPFLLGRSRRRVLGPLDQLLRLNQRAVLVLRDQLEADPAAVLVDFLDDHVHDVAAGHHVLDVTDPAGADVGDMKQPVGALRQLDEGAELGRLDHLARVLVSHLRRLGELCDRRDRGLGFVALGRIDEDVAVLLDVDLDVVVGLERADRLAALADHHPDLLGVDLDGGNTRRVAGELRPGLRDRLQHLVEDELPRPLRLLERTPEDLLRDAGDLDVHLQRRDALASAGDLEVHVAEMVFGSLDVGQDRVVVTFLDETHCDAGDRRLDAPRGVHQRQGRAADRAHRRRTVGLERLGDEPDRVRELLGTRDHRLEGPLRERTVADVAALRPPHEARLSDRVGREVVVVHVTPVCLERQVVDPLSLLGGAARQQRPDLRLAARKQRRPVRARRDTDLACDLADVLRAA